MGPPGPAPPSKQCLSAFSVLHSCSTHSCSPSTCSLKEAQAAKEHVTSLFLFSSFWGGSKVTYVARGVGIWHPAFVPLLQLWSEGSQGWCQEEMGCAEQKHVLGCTRSRQGGQLGSSKHCAKNLQPSQGMEYPGDLTGSKRSHINHTIASGKEYMSVALSHVLQSGEGQST